MVEWKAAREVGGGVGYRATDKGGGVGNEGKGAAATQRRKNNFTKFPNVVCNFTEFSNVVYNFTEFSNIVYNFTEFSSVVFAGWV